MFNVVLKTAVTLGTVSPVLQSTAHSHTKETSLVFPFPVWGRRTLLWTITWLATQEQRRGTENRSLMVSTRTHSTFTYMCHQTWSLRVMVYHLRQREEEGEAVEVGEEGEELRWLEVNWCLVLLVLLAQLLNPKTTAQCLPVGSLGRRSQHTARWQCLHQASCANGWCLAVPAPAAASRCWSASGRRHPSPWSPS